MWTIKASTIATKTTAYAVVLVASLLIIREYFPTLDMNKSIFIIWLIVYISKHNATMNNIISIQGIYFFHVVSCALLIKPGIARC